jgi:hypothetical protein
MNTPPAAPIQQLLTSRIMIAEEYPTPHSSPPAVNCTNAHKYHTPHPLSSTPHASPPAANCMNATIRTPHPLPLSSSLQPMYPSRRLSPPACMLQHPTPHPYPAASNPRTQRLLLPVTDDEPKPKKAKMEPSSATEASTGPSSTAAAAAAAAAAAPLDPYASGAPSYSGYPPPLGPPIPGGATGAAPP